MSRLLLSILLTLGLASPSWAVVETVVKTIGTTGTFSTPQLWEDGAPVALTTSERSACGTFLVAAFQQGEALTFVGSSATGKFLDTDSTGAGNGTYVTYGITAGNPATSDVVTGGTSGATCVLSSGTPTHTGIIWQGQLQNQEFAGTGVQLTITGSTVGATTYKELTTVAGASFNDHANKLTNPLRYDASMGAAIRGTSNTTATVTMSENFARMSNIQITATGTDSSALVTGNSAIIQRCIIEGTYSNTLATTGIVGGNSIFTLANSVVIQKTTAADHIVATGVGNSNFYNVTIVAPDDLATAPTSIFKSGASGTVTLQNVSAFAGDSSKAIHSGSATLTFTTSFSDISGTTGVTQATYGNEFMDVNAATKDFRLKTGASQIDAGTTDATNAATDIVKTARPVAGAYDVGAWEGAATTVAAALQSGQGFLGAIIK